MIARADPVGLIRVVPRLVALAGWGRACPASSVRLQPASLREGKLEEGGKDREGKRRGGGARKEGQGRQEGGNEGWTG